MIFVPWVRRLDRGGYIAGWRVEWRVKIGVTCGCVCVGHYRWHHDLWAIEICIGWWTLCRGPSEGLLQLPSQDITCGINMNYGNLYGYFRLSFAFIIEIYYHLSLTTIDNLNMSRRDDGLMLCEIYGVRPMTCWWANMTMEMGIMSLGRTIIVIIVV